MIKNIFFTAFIILKCSFVMASQDPADFKIFYSEKLAAIKSCQDTSFYYGILASGKTYIKAGNSSEIFYLAILDPFVGGKLANVYEPIYTTWRKQFDLSDTANTRNTFRKNAFPYFRKTIGLRFKRVPTPSLCGIPDTVSLSLEQAIEISGVGDWIFSVTPVCYEDELSGIDQKGTSEFLCK